MNTNYPEWIIHDKMLHNKKRLNQVSQQKYQMLRSVDYNTHTRNAPLKEQLITIKGTKVKVEDNNV